MLVVNQHDHDNKNYCQIFCAPYPPPPPPSERTECVRAMMPSYSPSFTHNFKNTPLSMHF